MSFQTRMVALLGVSGISDLVGSRVYAVEAPQDTVAPFVVWQRISSVVDHTHDGSPTQEVLVQVACYAKTFAESCAIRDAVRTAMEDGDASGPANLRDERDSKEQERNLYRCDIDFAVWQA